MIHKTSLPKDIKERLRYPSERSLLPHPLKRLPTFPLSLVQPSTELSRC